MEKYPGLLDHAVICDCATKDYQVCDMCQIVRPAIKEFRAQHERDQARIKELEVDAQNWYGNFILLANTINPTEDKPALEAASELIAERDRYKEALENGVTLVYRTIDGESCPSLYGWAIRSKLMLKH